MGANGEYEVRLIPSVITSSSILPVRDFFRELLPLHAPLGMDLMLVRPEDVDQMDVKQVANFVAADASAVGNPLRVAFSQWAQEAPDHPVNIRAIATYFPEISSFDDERRNTAKAALVNCVLLCRELETMIGVAKVVPCVEMVCGSILEPWVGNSSAHADQYVVQYRKEKKIERLVQSLREIVESLKQKHNTPPIGGNYAFSLELEPGESYVLNDDQTLRILIEHLDAPENAILKDVVGLNLDIAHYRIANVSDGCLQELNLGNRIVHAHLTDHPPGMHTRDQALGSFLNLEHCPTRKSDRDPTGIVKYLDLLMQRAIDYHGDQTGLLFTNTVALELEGCSRMSWIHNSIPQLKRLLEAARLRARP